MAGERLNRLAKEISKLCAEYVLEEKWVLAPSRRIGLQWLDAITRTGQPVLNARVMTITNMALELAAIEMERRGATYAQGMQIEVLLDGLICKLRESNGDGGYLSSLKASPGLLHTVNSTLRDLRLAGLSAAQLSSDLFEVTAKGHEIIILLSGYEMELSARRLMDYANVLRAAAERLHNDELALPEGMLLIMYEGMEDKISALERDLLKEVPRDKRVVLGVDRPCESSGDSQSDASLLAWISHPADAPPPRGDGTAEIHRAVGEVHEVRDVFRSCIEMGTPFDEVEILYTDAATYIPLIYEVGSFYATEPGEAVPITFAEGIPTRYSRPGRALKGWLSWINEEYPQSILVRMIQDGLLENGDKMTEGWSFTHLGAVLRSVPIGGNRDSYLSALDRTIFALERQYAFPDGDENAEGKEDEPEFPVSQRLEMLRSLRGMVADLLENTPGPDKSMKDILDGAAAFLQHRVRCQNEFDAYVRRLFLDDIGELAACFADAERSSLSALDWLMDLASSARVEGKGPRPGCIMQPALPQAGTPGALTLSS